MREDFGNSWRQMKTALLLGGAMGAVVWLAVPDLNAALTVGLVAPLCVAVKMLFTVRIEDGLITQRVGGFWRLRHGRMEDLAKVDFGCGRSAARLYFTNGACVRLPMADARELQALCVCLLESRPDFDNYVFSPRAARVEKMMQSFRAAAAQAPQVEQRKGHDRAEPGIATRAIPWGGLRRTRVA
ncbi:MAG TPA: hypothetical protein VGE39_15010 [Prosthecobacter sp.]